jgi:type II secretion system protein G
VLHTLRDSIGARPQVSGKPLGGAMRKDAAILILLAPALLALSRTSPTRTQIRQIEAALDFLRLDTGSYPTTEEGLEALISPPDRLVESYRHGGYLLGGAIPKDSWGNVYQYRFPGQHNPSSFDLWSLGADGEAGGTCANADIGNWRARPTFSIDCPMEDPLFGSLAFSAFVTGVVGVLALAFLTLVRSLQAAFHWRSWRSVSSAPPLALSLGLACIFVFMLLALVATSIP